MAILDKWAGLRPTKKNGNYVQHDIAHGGDILADVNAN